MAQQASSGGSTCLNIFYQNVRGLKTKLKPWRESLLLSEHNLVAATETFVDKSVEDAELISDDWTILRRDRNTMGGGVLLATRAPIVMHRQIALETDRGEDLWASFLWSGRVHYACVVYIHPRAKDENYMHWFCKVETFINKLKGTVIILGDLNLNSASDNVRNYYCYFKSFCNLNEMNDVVNAHGGILDVVLARVSNGATEIRVRRVEGFVKPDLYHPPLDIGVVTHVVRCSDRIEPSNIDPSRDWNFKKCDPGLLLELLSETSWHDVLKSNDVQSCTDQFYDIIYNISCVLSPVTASGRVYVRARIHF